MVQLTTEKAKSQHQLKAIDDLNFQVTDATDDDCSTDGYCSHLSAALLLALTDMDGDADRADAIRTLYTKVAEFESARPTDHPVYVAGKTCKIDDAHRLVAVDSHNIKLIDKNDHFYGYYSHPIYAIQKYFELRSLEFTYEDQDFPEYAKKVYQLLGEISLSNINRISVEILSVD